MKGLKLAKLFYEDLVRDMLLDTFPKLKYAAALIGAGSEVLGYDDETSQDHDWGVRLQLFLDQKDIHLRDEISEYFSRALPKEYKGYFTNWKDFDKNFNNQHPSNPENDYIHHNIAIYTVDEFLEKMFAHSKRDWDLQDWLKAPEQRLLAFTTGEVFSDTYGELSSMREYLAYYPDEVWYFCLQGELEQLAQNMVFAGRARMVNDQVGTRLLAAQQVERVVNIAFLLEREYRPYQKWVGTAFTDLEISRDLYDLLIEVLDAEEWETRESALNAAYMVLVHNLEEKGLIEKGKAVIKQFHNRPIEFVRIDLEESYLESKTGTILRGERYSTGSVNQIVRDRTLLSYPDLSRRLFNFDMVRKESL